MWDLTFAYELPTSVPLIKGNVSSSLLPTPSVTHNDGHNPEKFLARRERELAKGRNGNGFGLTLGMAVQLLPTPGANDSTGPEGETRKERQKKGTGGSALRDLKHLLPTPTAGDAHSSGSRKLPGSKAHPGTSLTDAVVREKLLSTPTVNDARNSGGPSQRRRNSLPLTEIARELTGDVIEQPSSDGPLSSEENLQDQLTIEDD
jgi:hypothetical protein